MSMPSQENAVRHDQVHIEILLLVDIHTCLDYQRPDQQPLHTTIYDVGALKSVKWGIHHGHIKSRPLFEEANNLIYIQRITKR